LITTRFIQTPLQHQYAKLLDAEGTQALGELKRLFGDSNLLSTVRNNFAYHYPTTSDAEAAFEAACVDPAFDDFWKLYISHHGYNSLFYFSELIFLHGIAGKAGTIDLAKTQEKLMGELSTALTNVVLFAKAFFAAVWVRNFGTGIEAKDISTIQDAPPLVDVSLPFFVELPSSVDGGPDTP
jgi:hypothetical protein